MNEEQTGKERAKEIEHKVKEGKEMFPETAKSDVKPCTRLAELVMSNSNHLNVSDADAATHKTSDLEPKNVCQILEQNNVLNIFQDQDIEEDRQEESRLEDQIPYSLSNLLVFIFSAIARKGKISFESMADYLKLFQNKFQQMSLLEEGRLLPAADLYRTIFEHLDPYFIREKTVEALYQLFQQQPISAAHTDDRGEPVNPEYKNILAEHTTLLTLYSSRKPIRINTITTTGTTVTTTTTTTTEKSVNLLIDMASSKSDNQQNEAGTTKTVVPTTVQNFQLQNLFLLLDPLNITGKYITLDRLHNCEEICAVIKEKEGYYVIAVKDDKTTAQKVIRDIFEDKSLEKHIKVIQSGQDTFKFYTLSRNRKFVDHPDTKTVIQVTSSIRSCGDLNVRGREISATVNLVSSANGNKNTVPTGNCNQSSNTSAICYYVSNSADMDKIIEAIQSRLGLENGFQKAPEYSHHQIEDYEHHLYEADGNNSKESRNNSGKEQEHQPMGLNAVECMVIITDLIGNLADIYRELKSDTELKTAKRIIQDKPLDTVKEIFDTLGKGEILRQLEKGSVDRKIARRKAQRWMKDSKNLIWMC